MPRRVQTDGSSGCWRQVDVSTSNPRTAIVDADCDASAVANANVSTKRQSAVSGCQCRTIKAFSARRLTTAETITLAINARYFRTRGATQKQQNRPNASKINPRLQSGPFQSVSAIFRTSLASPRCPLPAPQGMPREATRLTIIPTGAAAQIIGTHR